jgi:cytidylate kinase
MSSPASPTPRLVTISAPYGTGGSIVGPELAHRLDVPFVDRAIPAAISRRLDIPIDEILSHEESPQSGPGRWLAALAPAALMVGGSSAGILTPADEAAFRDATEVVLREYAARGAVILGRAGAIVLRDVPHALHVRLDAPRERRILQAMRLGSLNREAAEHELRASDLAREAYVKHWYRADPRDPRHYHLVLDSTTITLQGCAELITLALSHRGGPQDGD